MKKMLAYLLAMLMAGALYMCSETDEQLARSGNVQFNLAPEALSSGGRVKGDIPSGSYLLVSIETTSGAEVLNRQSLKLLKVGDQFLSPPLELTLGNYLLTEFLVVSPDDEVILATPKTGSTLAGAVADPLPVSFLVVPDQVSALTLEVVDVTESSPEDFGYASFGLDVVNVMKFQLSAFIPEGNAFALTDAQAFVLKDFDTLAVSDLAAKVNTVFFTEDPDETYTLAVIKRGYGRYTRDFTFNELTGELDGKPLPVVLEPALTFVARTYTAPQLDFSFGVGNEFGEGDVLVDWGDGTSETFSLDSYNFEHTYPEAGHYFVSVTGDLDKITSFYAFYDNGNITDHLYLNHLPELKYFAHGLTDSPKHLDFTDNKKLLTINSPGCTSLESVAIPADNQINFIDLSGPNKFTSQAVNGLIDSLYQSVISSNREGALFLDYLVFSDDDLFRFIGPPSPASYDKLRDLRDNYGWIIRPELF